MTTCHGQLTRLPRNLRDEPGRAQVIRPAAITSLAGFGVVVDFVRQPRRSGSCPRIQGNQGQSRLIKVNQGKSRQKKLASFTPIRRPLVFPHPPNPRPQPPSKSESVRVGQTFENQKPPRTMNHRTLPSNKTRQPVLPLLGREGRCEGGLPHHKSINPPIQPPKVRVSPSQSDL